MKTLVQRAQSQPPPFFRRIRNAGLALTALATAILTAPVGIPAILVTIAGYTATAGAVATAVSQLTLYEEPLNWQED